MYSPGGPPSIKGMADDGNETAGERLDGGHLDSRVGMTFSGPLLPISQVAPMWDLIVSFAIEVCTSCQRTLSLP